MASKHITVLLDEAVKGLDIKKNGNYVDATFGRGGHSKAILKQINEGHLLVIDQDPRAIEEADKMATLDKRVIVKHGAFEDLGSFIKESFTDKVDGILFDFGVSSPQIDEAERGFRHAYEY